MTSCARKCATAVGAVAAGIALAGCGGDTPATAASTGSAQTATTSGTQAVAEPPMRATGSPVVVASGILYPSGLAFDSHGGLWVVAAAIGPTAPGGIWYVPPGGKPRAVTTGLTAPQALLWVGKRLYASDAPRQGDGRITVLDGFTGDHFKRRHVLLDDLSDGSHTIGSIVQGPNGRLFVGLGALEDHSGPPGRIVSFPQSGGTPMLAATGVRTAYGLAFWGRTLLVTDNGADHPGSGFPDQLLAFQPGGRVVNFGFPKCLGQGGHACAGFRAPLARFPAHSTPTGIAVKGDVAFVADNGSSILPSPAPSAIIRVDLRTGRWNVFWRSPHEQDLVGVAIGPDGNLYATLLTSGKVVRFHL